MKKIFFVTLYLFSLPIFAQKPQTPTPSEIFFRMEQLNVLASALYVAAHPDDENTRLITYLTHHDKAYTSYISLTPGNGGQNLISDELGTDLGIIRTHELWNARKIDGGKQYFSTADDFGYSKHPKEAFEKWNKASLLQQMVYLIRTEQPDIVINRFDHRTEGNTHGHHTASAQLSREAFDLALDKNYTLPNNEKLPTWQPTRLFFNTSWFFYGSKEAFAKADKSKYVGINIGEYYQQLGKNNQEIASLSRSQHMSQGFGDLSSRGEEMDYVELIAGKKLNTDNLFEGIDTSWNRIEGGQEIKPIVEQLLADYDFRNPSKSIQLLTEIYQKIDQLPESIWKNRKKNEVKNLIKDCAGLFLDATTNQPYTTPNTQVAVNVEVSNRSEQLVKIKAITLNQQKKSIDVNLSNQQVFFESFPVNFSDDDLTNFKFLKTFSDFKNQFESNQKNKITLEINNVPLDFPLDIQYRYKDEVKGEVYQPFHVVPTASVRFEQPIYINNIHQKQEINVITSNYLSDNFDGNLIITDDKNSPKSVMNEHNIHLVEGEMNQQTNVGNNFTNGEYQAILYPKQPQKAITSEVKWVDYDHIPLTYYLKDSKTTLVDFDNSGIKKQRIGYIMGAGDEIPKVLENVGYQVDLINLETLTAAELTKYETVIVGIRAFNTEEELAVKNQLLFDYVANGGVVITQYQTNRNLKTQNIAPYPIEIGRTRVTDENAKVRFINPKMTVLNQPFVISESNFKGWVQEQGLYYADEFSDEFTPVFYAQDFDEKPTNGALLIAQHGKGHYVYTGLSFFRQLPAGNIGALELFINLIEL